MEAAYRTAKIRKGTFQYRQIPDSTLYEFVLPQGKFRFLPWNWGEKNRVINDCVSFDPSTHRFRLDIPKFNECVLLTTLKSAQQNGNEAIIDLAMIRNLDVGLGDLLLDICRWINYLGGSGPEEAETPLRSIQLIKDRGTKAIRYGDYTFTFRPWTWGEKNRILGQCVIPENDDHPLRLSSKKFNELMLLTSLAKVTRKDEVVEVTPRFLQNMDARLGDALLELAQDINEITVDEKKN